MSPLTSLKYDFICFMHAYSLFQTTGENYLHLGNTLI